MNKKIIPALAAIALLVLIIGAVLTAQWPNSVINGATSGSTNALGVQLFNNYGLTFLIVGLVMFVSMLGGIYIAQEEKE